MSQYLSHIAQLAVNQVPVVQPRLASRFEGSVGVAPAEDVQERVAQTPVARSNPEALATESHTRAQPPVTENAHESAPAQISAAALLQPQAALPTKAMAIESAVQTPAVPKPEVLVQELIRERIHEQPLLVAAPVQQNVVPAAEKPGISKPDIERHTEQAFFTEIRHEVAAPAAAEKHAASTGAGARQEPAAATKAPHIQTRIAQPEPIAPQIHQQAQVIDSPAPSIQVSIGRIEIRANPASTSQAAKPKSGPATLSLDDYLKQRKGDR